MKTRAKILRAILYDGPASRAELSKKLGISASGITDSAAQLCEEGILIESGYRPKDGRGRKNILLDVDTSYKFAFGVGVYGRVVCVGLTTVRGDTLGKSAFVFHDGMPKEELVVRITKMIHDILRDCCIDFDRIIGIGLCLDGDARKLLGDEPPAFISGVRMITEQADGYIEYSKAYLPVNPEELYIYGCGKVIRDLFISPSADK